VEEVAALVVVCPFVGLQQLFERGLVWRQVGWGSLGHGIQILIRWLLPGNMFGSAVARV
jgi:hypothetical protein